MNRPTPERAIRLRQLLHEHFALVLSECGHDRAIFCRELTGLTIETAQWIGSMLGGCHLQPHAAALQFMAIMCCEMQAELRKKDDVDPASEFDMSSTLRH